MLLPQITKWVQNVTKTESKIKKKVAACVEVFKIATQLSITTNRSPMRHIYAPYFSNDMSETLIFTENELKNCSTEKFCKLFSNSSMNKKAARTRDLLVLQKNSSKPSKCLKCQKYT